MLNIYYTDTESVLYVDDLELAELDD